MFKKSTIFILTLTFTLSLTTSVFAEPTKQSLTKQQQQIQSQQNNLNKSMSNSNLSFEDANKQIAAISSQIQSLDSKIEGLNANISDSNIKIESKKAEIKAAEVKLAKNLADLEEEQELYSSRMRSMYIQGPVQDATIILASKSLDDFFANLEAVQYLSKLDKQITKQLSDTMESITETKKALVTQNTQLVAANTDLQNKLTEVTASKTKQSALITEAKSRQALYATQVAGYKSQLDATNKQAIDTGKQLQALVLKEQADAKQKADAAAAKLAANTSQPNRGTQSTTTIAPPATTNAIIAYAYGFMGTTYVWGGTQPNPGFDCSGFLQYVYRHFGVNISRTTFTQINEGRAVSRDQLQPGDLVFFGSYSDPHHVAMYVGNGCVIHAPHTGDVIKISSLSAFSDFLCARRILN